MTRRLIALVLVLGAAAPLDAQRIRLPASLSQLEQRAQQDSNDAAAHYNVALAYINEKRFDDAQRALRVAVAIEPKFAPAWLALGRLVFMRRPRLWDEIYERRVPDEWRDSLREADRAYQRALLIDPLVDLRIDAVGRPGRSAYWTSSELAEQIYDYLFRFLDDLQEGRYESAYNRLNQLYDETPTDLEREHLPDFIFYYRGLAAAHIGRYPEALVDFSRLLRRSEGKIHPDSLVYYLPIETNAYRYMVAVLNLRAGDPNAAIEAFRQVLEEDAGYYMAHVQLANIYENNRLWPQAIDERRNAVNANPDDASLLLDFGMTLAKGNQWAAAETALRQAAETNPRDTRALYYLGIVEQQLAKPTEARDAFTRFLALAPSRYDRQVADAKQRLTALP